MAMSSLRLLTATARLACILLVLGGTASGSPAASQCMMDCIAGLRHQHQGCKQRCNTSQNAEGARHKTCMGACDREMQSATKACVTQCR